MGQDGIYIRQLDKFVAWSVDCGLTLRDQSFEGAYKPWGCYYLEQKRRIDCSHDDFDLDPSQYATIPALVCKAPSNVSPSAVDQTCVPFTCTFVASENPMVLYAKRDTDSGEPQKSFV